jgi:hypothetical protein
MKKVLIGFCILSVFLTMCKEQSENEVAPSLLYGKHYVLRIDMISNLPDVQFPGNNLKESDYVFSDEDIQYDITFSENGQYIKIEPGTIQGKRVELAVNYVQYELDEGLFAGGRFIIRMNDTGYAGEFTIYGSGVPIIKSFRGKLEATRPQ